MEEFINHNQMARLLKKVTHMTLLESDGGGWWMKSLEPFTEYEVDRTYGSTAYLKVDNGSSITVPLHYYGAKVDRRAKLLYFYNGEKGKRVLSYRERK